MTLSDLAYGPVCSDLPVEDRALQIAEAVEGVADLEAECERLRGEVAELQDDGEELERTRGALRNLVEAIEGVKVGKTARVGSLIVVGPDRDFASELGEALEKAKAAL